MRDKTFKLIMAAFIFLFGLGASAHISRQALEIDVLTKKLSETEKEVTRLTNKAERANSDKWKARVEAAACQGAKGDSK